MKVLISSASFGKINQKAIHVLEKEGFTPIINPFGRKLTFDEFTERIKDATALIAGTEKITEEILKHAPNLKVISRYGVGVDNIDLLAAKERRITICNTSEAPSQAVAELTLALILNIIRRISEADRGMRNKNWQQLNGSLLMGKTIGIVGLGRIGKKIIELIKPFKMTIFTYDPYPDWDFISQHNIVLASLNDVLSKSDIVSLHLPLSEKTFHLIGEEEFLMFKKGALLINASRGGLIDEKALAVALRDGIIAGAGIDTFEEEPYIGELTEFENVVLTCHMGSSATETREQMELEAVMNIIRVLKGEQI